MSFLFELHPSKEASADFIAEVGLQLQQALVCRKEIGKLTQQEIAQRLGVDRSRVNRCFSGHANLTLESLSELVWAIDGEISLEIQIKNFKEKIGNHIVACASNDQKKKAPSAATTSSPSSNFFNWEFETTSANKQVAEIL